MTEAEKEKPEKPSAGSDTKGDNQGKKPEVPQLPPGTKIGKGGGGIRTNVQVPILQKGVELGHGGGGVRTLTEKIEPRTEEKDKE